MPRPQPTLRSHWPIPHIPLLHQTLPRLSHPAPHPPTHHPCSPLPTQPQHDPQINGESPQTPTLAPKSHQEGVKQPQNRFPTLYPLYPHLGPLKPPQHLQFHNVHYPNPTRQAPSDPPSQHVDLDCEIARLMELGYSFDDVNRALSIANNNSAVAAQILRSF
uniref:UBA domain-containing protein n=1 Tax=Ciona intestinalis TaxID=7719 RepID=H2Y2P8_CIOIN